jgi:transposase
MGCKIIIFSYIVFSVISKRGIKEMQKKSRYNTIPVSLSVEQFEQFVLPHLVEGKRGPSKKISLHKIFNYILQFMHTGCQWKSIPIAVGADGKPEIHYSNIFKAFKFWHNKGCFAKLFVSTVSRLSANGKLDTSIIHGDGTTNAAKKGAII